jgi:hypothetical protein
MQVAQQSSEALIQDLQARLQSVQEECEAYRSKAAASGAQLESVQQSLSAEVQELRLKLDESQKVRASGRPPAGPNEQRCS